MLSERQMPADRSHCRSGGAASTRGTSRHNWRRRLTVQGLPVKHAMSPGAVTDAAVGAAEVEKGDLELDIIDALAGRIRAVVASGEFGDDKNEKPPGNGTAAEAGRAAAVPPALTRAAERLVSVGCPPLRVEKRYGATLALHLLQTKDTFTSWAESRGLSGGPLLARSSHHRSRARCRNAQLRREVPAGLAGRALAAPLVLCVPGGEARELHAQPASGRAAGRGVLAELPACILCEMSEALKLELKIEQLVKS